MDHAMQELKYEILDHEMPYLRPDKGPCNANGPGWAIRYPS